MHGDFVIGETALPRAKRTEGSSVVGAKAKGSILSIVPGQCYKAMSPYPHSFAQYISCPHARNVEMAGMQKWLGCKHTYLNLQPLQPPTVFL